MPSLRTKQARITYEEYLRAMPADSRCALCEKEPLQEFEHWRIVENSFPHDLVARTHHMIIPKRHAIEAELAAEELEEFRVLKSTVIEQGYDYIFEMTPKNKSVPQHYHLHLLIGIPTQEQEAAAR